MRAFRGFLLFLVVIANAACQGLTDAETVWCRDPENSDALLHAVEQLGLDEGIPDDHLYGEFLFDLAQGRVDRVIDHGDYVEYFMVSGEHRQALVLHAMAEELAAARSRRPEVAFESPEAPLPTLPSGAFERACKAAFEAR